MLSIAQYISQSSSEKPFLSVDGNKHTGPQLVIGQRLHGPSIPHHLLRDLCRGGETERWEEPEPEAEYTKQCFLDKAGQLLEVKHKASPSSSQSTFQLGGRK